MINASCDEKEMLSCEQKKIIIVIIRIIKWEFNSKISNDNIMAVKLVIRKR